MIPQLPGTGAMRGAVALVTLAVAFLQIGCGLGDVGHDPVKYQEHVEKLAKDDAANDATDDAKSADTTTAADAGTGTDTSAADIGTTDAADATNATDAATGDVSHPDAGASDTGSPDSVVSVDAGACSTDKDCDDGDACTVGEKCGAGNVCLPGKATVCDDGDPCTADSCNKTTGCVFGKAGADGLDCSDGNACTYGDTCKGGVCLAGAATDCDDGNVCTDDACLPASGCTVTNVADQANCDDGDSCTKTSLTGATTNASTDHCSNGVCKSGEPVTCDDKDPCTKDACSSKKGCQHTSAKGAACDDNEICTVGDTCDDKGQCVPGATKKDCDDKNICTIDACKQGKGCVHVAQNEGKACDDNNVCTGKSACEKGACKGSDPKTCKVQHQCQTWTCDPKKGCIFGKANGAGCTDNSVCTLTDICKDGVCTPGKKKDCDDKNACTNDSCDAKKGCQNVNADGKACSDGKDCTTVDVCKGGKCISSPSLFKTITPLPGKGVLGVAAAVAGRSGGKFLTWHSTFRLQSFPVLHGAIVQRNSAGHALQELPVGGSMVEAVALVPSGKLVYAIGGVTAFGGSFTTKSQARVIALDDSGKLKPAFDKAVGNIGTIPKAAVAMTGGGVRIFGAYRPEKSFSEALSIGISASGAATKPAIVRRGAHAEFNGGTTYAKNGAAYAACGGIVWSGRGHSDMWMATLSAAGQPVFERRFDFGKTETCHAIVAVDKGFVLAGESRPNDIITNGHVFRIDEAGRPMWSRLVDSPTGGVFNRLVTQTKRAVLVGGTIQRLQSNKTIPAVNVVAIDVDTGSPRWSWITDDPKVEGLFDLAVQPTGHVLIAGARELPKDQLASLVQRLGPFGEANCSQPGKCFGVLPAKCEDANPCTNDECDAGKGCTNVALPAHCDDGDMCTGEGLCKSGKCTKGGARLAGHHLAKANFVGGTIAADFEGGWLVGATASTGKFGAVAPGGGTNMGDGAADGRAVFAARSGGFVQHVAVDSQGVNVVLGDIKTMKEAPIAAGSSPLAVAQVDHIGSQTSRRDAAVDGNVLAAVSTVASGKARAVQIVIAGLPTGFDAGLGWKEGSETKTLWDGGSQSDLYAYAVAVNPQLGFYVGAHRHAKGDPEALSTWIRGVEDTGKLTGWLYKDEGKVGSRVKLIRGLAGARNGDALLVLHDNDTKGVKQTYLLKRIAADDAKLRWSKPLDVALQGSLPVAVRELHDGSVITALTGKTSPIAIFRVEAGTNLLLKTGYKPGKPGRPSAFATDPFGGVAMLLTDTNIYVQTLTPWLQSTCAAAGNCVRESALTCTDNTPCTNHACDPKSGCKTVATGPGSACNDGDACLQGAKCNAGTCTGGAAKTCSDGVPCTIDRCDPASGQCHAAPAHTSCGIPAVCKIYACSKKGCEVSNMYDGAPCAVGKTCKAGVCK